MSDDRDVLIDLYIYFTGLIVFAEEARAKPGRRVADFGPDPLPRVHALIVDVRNPQLEPSGVPDADKRRTVLPHLPVVQFLWEQAKSSPEVESGLFRRISTPSWETAADDWSRSYQAARKEVVPLSQTSELPPDRGLWILEKEILQLDPTMATTEKDLIIDRSLLSPELAVPGKNDMGSIEWVAPMRGKGNGVAKLKKGITDPLNSPEAKRRLAGSFLLDRGRLSPAAFASELGHFITFKTMGAERALVSVLELNVQIRGRDVRIISTRFDGSSGPTLRLEPNINCGGESARVEIWVLNREWIAIRDQIPARPVEYGFPNPEYLFLYDLIEDDCRPGEDEFPVAMETVSAMEGGTWPGARPCKDQAMRRIYFASGTFGEAALSAPCSPTFVAAEGQG